MKKKIALSVFVVALTGMIESREASSAFPSGGEGIWMTEGCCSPCQDCRAGTLWVQYRENGNGEWEVYDTRCIADGCF